MKEYIKKFPNATKANNYSIVDIPFTTSIATTPIQNLVCNLENKKIVVNEQGNASIVDDAPELISFTIGGDTYQAEKRMKWGEWVESVYNTNGYYLTDFAGFNGVVYIISIGNNHYYVCTGDENGPYYGYPVLSSEEINNNGIYWTDNSPIDPMIEPIPVV